MHSKIRRMLACQTYRIPIVVGLIGALACGIDVHAHGQTVLNFNDVPPGTLIVFSPYTSQGFTLTSSSGGFVFNSPDTGNASPQPIGNNPFYAGANGLTAFSPATITLVQTDGNPFSLLSIDLARHFAFDPPPTVTFTGMLAGGGTVSETFTVTTSSPPLTFQTFDFTGFTGLASVIWDQPTSTQGLHQFGNIHLSTMTATVPEPGSFGMLASTLFAGGLLLLRCRTRVRHGANS